VKSQYLLSKLLILSFCSLLCISQSAWSDINLLDDSDEESINLLGDDSGGDTINLLGDSANDGALNLLDLTEPLQTESVPAPEKKEEEKEPSVTPYKKTPEQLHAELMASAGNFPTAAQCGQCHQQVYYEWSLSNHAYAAISPMFNKFEQKISEVSSGTVGSFCLRCHSGVGTSLGEQRHEAPWTKVDVANEGVTCISCHKVDEEYGRVNGERRINQGNLAFPVYGNIGGDGVSKALKEGLGNVVAQDPSPKGQRTIHAAGVRFRTIDQSEFCVSCHQVAVHPGIKLEVVWEQYRDSPALDRGVSCQDCHMGKVPGKNEGYDVGPAAIIGGRVVKNSGQKDVHGNLTGYVEMEKNRNGEIVGDIVNHKRKHSNHSFWGPGYPIVHPGIFPHNWMAQSDPAYQFSIEAWLTFNWRQKWGSDEFERSLAKGEIQVEFPEEWSKRSWRKNAWKVISQNLERLDFKKEMRRSVMENGSHIDGPFFDSKLKPGKDLKFHYVVKNTNDGHNLPSGSLGAQPEIWLNVALINPAGENVWESGYIDQYGDMADVHSRDVRNGVLKYDSQLFNLQTKFLTTNVKGTDREVYLPVPFDFDVLPFLRPAPQPVSVLNHPPFIRMEGRSIPPLASRKASYKVPGKLLNTPGKYKLQVRLRSRAEPIYFMKYVGATPEMQRAMNEWMLDIHEYAAEFEIGDSSK
jgi:hypothetical protein